MLRLSLLSNDDAWKWRILTEKLGIPRVGDDTPHQSWLRAMCQENGVPFTVPVDRGLADVILHDANLRRFSFMLA